MVKVQEHLGERSGSWLINCRLVTVRLQSLQCQTRCMLIHHLDLHTIIFCLATYQALYFLCWYQMLVLDRNASLSFNPATNLSLSFHQMPSDFPSFPDHLIAPPIYSPVPTSVLGFLSFGGCQRRLNRLLSINTFSSQLVTAPLWCLTVMHLVPFRSCEMLPERLFNTKLKL